jgi:hypothetical protein
MTLRDAHRPAAPAGLRNDQCPAAADDVTMPAHDRFRGDQQPQAPAPRFGYHGEQGREQGTVCQFSRGRHGRRRCRTVS